MNLFATDNNPVEAAKHLDDIRLNKMITESCQMLVIALVRHGLPQHLIPITKLGKPYKTKGHANHPVTKWTGDNRENFMWHMSYLSAMLGEYHYRTGKIRAGIDVADTAHQWFTLIPDGKLMKFQNSSLYISKAGDTVGCYRSTMRDKWMADKIKVKWTKRKPPEWCNIPVVESDGVYYRLTEKEASEIEDLLVSQT